MKRGFTIIEVLVVITVISILITITMVSFTNYQNRSTDSQAKTIVAAVRAGAERYYSSNDEYPSAAVLFGGTPTGSAPASYAAASTALGVSTDILNSSRIDFVPCAGTCNITDTTKVYYLTKTATDGTAQRQYTVTSCTYTFPTTEDGSLSYIIMYYSRQDGYWKTSRSERGVPTTSDTILCPFTGS
jgi:prepilin-type N-terminal cleavage/methylation domain-containing protein